MLECWKHNKNANTIFFKEGLIKAKGFIARVSKFVAENVFNKGIFYSTKYSTMNPTINDKEIFQILFKIDDFV